MIYDYPAIDEPIRQGDIFVTLPRIDLSLSRIALIAGSSSKEIVETNWNDVLDSTTLGTEPPVAALALRPVAAIVATQDCDALRAQDITLCEIRPFREVERKSKDTKSPKSWVNILTQQARINLKWFYLPPDGRIGFSDKMAVDFMVTLRLQREDLERLRALRKARLKRLALEHYRERLSEFFRRYPYDEWYALDAEEMRSYEDTYPGVRRFPWQVTGTNASTEPDAV